MKTRTKNIVIGIGIVAVIAEIWAWQRDRHQTARITTVAGLKQVGLSFRWERNDIARFTAEGELLKPPAKNDAQ